MTIDERLIGDYQAGYIIPHRDLKTLREKLKYSIDNESARTSIGILARQKYEAELTFQHMYHRTYAVYKEVIAKQADTDKIKFLQ